MISDFEPIIWHLDGREIRVYAIADVHIGARECQLKEFKAFIKRISEDDDSYLVICGDLLNNCTRSSVSDIFEEVYPPSVQIEIAAEILEPVKDKILGCVGGNHELRSRRETDLNPLYDVFVLIGKRGLFRENMCFIRVVLERGKTKNRHSLLLIHGKSASKRAKFDLAVDGIDAIIGGHLHAPETHKSGKLVFSENNTVSVKPFLSLTATSWLGYGGYASRSLLLPQSTADPQCLVLGWSGSNSRNGKISVAW